MWGPEDVEVCDGKLDERRLEGRVVDDLVEAFHPRLRRVCVLVFGVGGSGLVSLARVESKRVWGLVVGVRGLGSRWNAAGGRGGP